LSPQFFDLQAFSLNIMLNVQCPGLIQGAENKFIEALAIRDRIMQKMGFADLVPPMISGFNNPVLSAVQLEPDRPDALSRLVDNGNSDGNASRYHRLS
jgi:hypothetical protein